MNPRWEYLRLVWTYQRNRVGDGRKATGGLKKRWSYDSVFEVWWPGAVKPQRGAETSSPEPEPTPRPAVVSNLINKIGDEGWELATHAGFTNPEVPTENHGAPAWTGIALGQEWTFKRRLED